MKVRDESELRLRKQIQEKALMVQQEIIREAQSSGEIVGTLERYLEEDEFYKKAKDEIQPEQINAQIYIELEKEKADLFIFIQIFAPKLYQKYVKVD